MDYINIDKSLIPYEFEIKIKDETYRFIVSYNSDYDFFTIDLYKGEEAIVIGEKVVYGRPLFVSALYRDIPKAYILPFDLAQKEDKVTFENFNEQVFLYLVELE